MVDKDSWQKAEGLLPPEILKHYKDGEYVNKFVDWPMAKYNTPPDFKAGTDANEGKFTTSPEGTIIDKATGKQPPVHHRVSRSRRSTTRIPRRR